MLGRLMGIAIFSLLTTNANATECADSAAASDNIPSAIIECLRVIEEENAELRRDLENLIQQTDGPELLVPSGAVIAFDRPQGCPGGWTDMGPQWRGLTTVVAVSDTNDAYGFRRTGGEPEVTLSVDEMPRHSHSFTGTPIRAGGWGGNVTHPVGVGDHVTHLTYVPSGTIGHAGGDPGTGQTNPHNNMPPYIALYYCKKD